MHPGPDRPSGVVPQALAPIFLHAGFRSAGTSVWSSFRRHPQVLAFYEPLHEQLAQLRAGTVGRFRPQAWPSGHDDFVPYFEEYRALIPTRRRGVAGFQNRFAYQDFYLEADASDIALKAYLDRLTDAAHAQARVPVLKFCRSSGRVGWMQKQFPQALHVGVLRDPVSQWRSARRLMESAGNAYFITAPFLMLACNAANPKVRLVIESLQVPTPNLVGLDPGFAAHLCRRHVSRLTWAERYRGFLASWALNVSEVLRAGIPTLDPPMLSTSRRRREDLEARIRSHCGLDISLSSTGPPPPDKKGPTSADTPEDAWANHAVQDFLAQPAIAPAGLRGRATLRRLTASLPCGQAGTPPAPRQAAADAIPRWGEAALYRSATRIADPLRRARAWLDP